MKRLLSILFSICSLVAFAQQKKMAGIWEGTPTGVPLRLVFQFSEDAKGKFTCKWKSPQQSPKFWPTDSTYIIGDSIFTSSAQFHITFNGKLINDSTITGSFVQGASFALQLKKVQAITEVKRPQTPVGPFPYNSHDTIFFNAAKTIQFGATLTYPKSEAGKATYPVAILITGSGPQDRDETMFLHKPFAVIADHLTKNGFAVLRVDDRGIGKSTGNFQTATTADFADDVEAAIDYVKTLPQIDTNKIGLIGHSEGGMIAPMVASRRKEVQFIVLLAGPGIPIIDLMNEQVEAVSLSNGKSVRASKFSGEFIELMIEAVNKSSDSTILYANLSNIHKMIEQWAVKTDSSVLLELDMATLPKREEAVAAKLAALQGAWYKYFIQFTPVQYLKKLHCNVLALNGEKDIQVLPASNTAGILAALKESKAKKYEVKVLPGLNHLFQACKKCTVSEYGDLEETFSPPALDIITNWLKKNVQ